MKELMKQNNKVTRSSPWFLLEEFLIPHYHSITSKFIFEYVFSARSGKGNPSYHLKLKVFSEILYTPMGMLIKEI